MMLLRKWAPESLGTLGFLFFGFWAYTGRMPLPIILLIGILSAAGLWLASQTAVRMTNEGKKGRVSSTAIILATAVPLFTGFLIKMQGLGREATVWGTIFFWCGITVGLAMGTYGTYHQMK